MPWLECEECEEHSYSAAPLRYLRDPSCGRCGGQLRQLSEEESRQIEQRMKEDPEIQKRVRQKKMQLRKRVAKEKSEEEKKLAGTAE